MVFDRRREPRLDFTPAFKEALEEERPWFPVVYDLARRNSTGRLWIIGGFVYRNIIKTFYGGPPLPKEKDVDFMIEDRPPQGKLDLPEEWAYRMSRYGNLELTMGDIKVGLNYLFNFSSLLIRNLDPTMDNFFPTTPLNLQAIAYSFEDEKVLGWRGILSIRKKLVRINNLTEAKRVAEDLGISLGDLVAGKANELGFNYDLSLPKREENPADLEKKIINRMIIPGNDFTITKSPKKD